MVTYPPVPYPKRRRIKRPRRTPPPAPLAITGVVNVVQTAQGLEVNLLLDSTAEDPVQTDGADPAKWSATFDNSAFSGVSVEAVSYNELFIVLGYAGDDPAPGRIVYAANPSDISTASGKKLGACEVGLT